MYIQRYIPHLPAAGEVVIFDRSWYNRAGVERVLGFCTPEQSERFLDMTPAVEKAMVDSGIMLLKYWLEVGEDEQTKRLQSRVDDPRKIWKLSEMDLQVVLTLVRLRPGPRRDVRHDEQRVGAVARGPHRRQAARSAEPHHPPARSAALHAAGDEAGDVPGAPGTGRLPRSRPVAVARADGVLTRT